MARKKRNGPDVATDVQITEKVYDTAIYARLSVEDSGNKDSDSIVNQIYLVNQYIEKHPYLKLRGVFADNGQTGVNFDRPQFIALMDEIKAGRINCVCVKDLSRFGRNYIEAGEYIEKIFPFMGVRFVSVNDGFDNMDGNSNSDALIVALKNLINDVYAKDISQKVISSLRTKQKKGEYIGGLPIYGYKKSEQDYHTLVIDEETAPVVRDIFKWKAEGMSDPAIARRLNEMGVPSPAKRHVDRGEIKKTGSFKLYLWRDRTIRGITVNPMYLGHMTQGKTKQALCDNMRIRNTAMSEWIIVENTHEAIVDADTFERAQQARIANTRPFFRDYDKSKHVIKEDYLFKGLLFCGDCGSAMKRQRYDGARTDLYGDRFFCPIQRRRLGAGCSCKSVSEKELYVSALQSIKKEIAKAVDLSALVERMNREHSAAAGKDVLSERIAVLQKDLKRITNLKASLYASYADKLLSESDYIYSKQRYEQQIDDIKSELERLQGEMIARSETLTPKNKWIEAFKRFIGHDELSKEMVDALIEKVIVRENGRCDFVWRFRDEYEALSQYAGTNNAVDNVMDTPSKTLIARIGMGAAV